MGGPLALADCASPATSGVKARQAVHTAPPRSRRREPPPAQAARDGRARGAGNGHIEAIAHLQLIALRDRDGIWHFRQQN
ncbi:protein of unknown function [Rhodovastum atsumiense]|nr:protein of unknown function [Rhodovastum atsumiense]